MIGTALQRFSCVGGPGDPTPRRALLPVVALVAVAMAWGGAFVVVKSAVGQISPAGLVAWRFTIATSFLWLCQPFCLRGVRVRTVVSAIALGGLFGAGFLLQTWGIQSTTVVLSAFIAGSAVVLAPLVARLWFGRRVNRSTAAAIGLATAGLALISLRGSTFGAGELLTLAAAGWWAVHLVALERWSRSSEVMAMALVQLAVVAGLGWVAAAMLPGVGVLPSSPSAWTGLVTLGIFGTGIPLVLLTWAQARVTATTSAVVLTLEPVFGAVAAITVGGEEWAGLIVLGALVVVAGAVIVARNENGGGAGRSSPATAPDSGATLATAA